MRRFLLILSAIGALVFAGALVVSFTNPLLIERAAREIVRIEVERKTGEQIDALTNSRVAGLAQRALKQTDADIERTRQAIRDEVPQRVANVIANMLKADCECRKRLVRTAEQAENDKLSSLGQVRERLTSLIESAYASVTRNLLREFRIFTGANAVAFLILGLTTVLRRRASLQLALPAALLGAVVVTGGFYLFAQNWLHTIVFGDYVGLAYGAYLGGVAIGLIDVLVNRARMTTVVVNAVFSVLGLAIQAAPC